MLGIALWLYTLVVAAIWWFFLIAKIHFFKFKEYSIYVYPATKILMIFLVILTIIWYYLVYNISSSSKTVQTVQESASNENY